MDGWTENSSLHSEEDEERRNTTELVATEGRMDEDGNTHSGLTSMVVPVRVGTPRNLESPVEVGTEKPLEIREEPRDRRDWS